MTNRLTTTRGRPLELTEEQRAVVESRSPALRVVAFAGAGKTSTLRAYAAARPGVRMLYVAFNAAVAREARASFPANVTCSTMHALAYRVIGRRYQHKLRTSLRAHQAARALGLNPSEVSDLSAAEQSLVALRHFLSSEAVGWDEFQEQHPYRPDALAAAERLWARMIDPQDRLPMLHDGYLKLYQLTGPRLGYDVVLFDEAQDANPVTLAILRAQRCRKVYVGDPHQQIYQFRYAINGMAGAELDEELCLSESFRYGAELAAAANRLLALKGETRKVRGGRRGEPSTSQAFIARGNAAIYRQAVELARTGQQAHWVGGIEGYRLEQLLDVWRLRFGQREAIRDGFLAGFADYASLCVYCEEQDQRDLKAWLLLLDRHERCSELPAEVAAVQGLAVDQASAGVLSLCTAHKSKGLEFGVVTLAEDFPSAETLPLLPKPPAGEEPEACNNQSRSRDLRLWDGDEFLGAVVLPEEELNLRYVAVTRAEAECRSGLWPAPMFQELEDYRARFPRCLLLDEFPQVVAAQQELEPLPGRQLPGRQLPPEPLAVEELKPEKAEARPEETDVKPELVPVERVEPAGSGPEQASAKPLQRLIRAVRHLSLVPQARRTKVEQSTPGCQSCPEPAREGAMGGEEAVSGGITVWYQGALDPVRIRVVVEHYSHRYPALEWGWLLSALAELRLVAEPQAAVCSFAEQHQLESAQPLLDRFLRDVGLWLVAD